MSWVAVAVAGTALVTSYMQSQSARKATNAQIDAANQANALQTSQYNNQTKLQAPWRNAGASSIGYLSYLMGVPGYQNWQPGMDMGSTQKVAAPTPMPHQKYNGATFLSSTGATGDPLNVFGLAAHPQTGNEGETSPTAMSGGYNTPSVATQGLPKFNSPADYGFQQLPSGAQFVGPDGIVRRKH